MGPKNIYNRLFLKSLHNSHVHPAGLLLLLLSCPLAGEKCPLWRMKCSSSCISSSELPDLGFISNPIPWESSPCNEWEFHMGVEFLSPWRPLSCGCGFLSSAPLIPEVIGQQACMDHLYTLALVLSQVLLGKREPGDTLSSFPSPGMPPSEEERCKER